MCLVFVAPCNARVLQRGDDFNQRGDAHTHAGVPGAAAEAEMKKKAASLATDQEHDHTSGLALAEKIQRGV